MRETHLINKIKKGDQRALDTLLQEMYPQVYTFVYRKLQGDDVAKDVTQETFLRFIRQIVNYRCEGKTLHYLYKIAGNVCRDHYRKSKRESYESIESKETMLSSEEDVHESILNQMRNEELMLYIRQLSEDQQNVILLKYFHQMTFKEIATLYEVSDSTIKSRHIAALKKLKSLWKEDTYVTKG